MSCRHLSLTVPALGPDRHGARAAALAPNALRRGRISKDSTEIRACSQAAHDAALGLPHGPARPGLPVIKAGQVQHAMHGVQYALLPQAGPKTAGRNRSHVRADVDLACDHRPRDAPRLTQPEGQDIGTSLVPTVRGVEAGHGPAANQDDMEFGGNAEARHTFQPRQRARLMQDAPVPLAVLPPRQADRLRQSHPHARPPWGTAPVRASSWPACAP